MFFLTTLYVDVKEPDRKRRGRKRTSRAVRWPESHSTRSASSLTSPAVRLEKSVGFRNGKLTEKNGLGRFCFSPSLLVSLSPCLPRSASVGVTGFEPVTLRLSSACSNQLSYTPGVRWTLAAICLLQFSILTLQ